MIHLITYGDDKYKLTKERIKQEALKTGWFSSIDICGKKDLSKNFRREYKKILSLPRGGGYWIWKFNLILGKLENMKEGEVLVYLDSGCTINLRGKTRLDEYLTMLKEAEGPKIISFQMGFLEREYTTKEIFEVYEAEEWIRDSGQYITTIMIMEKSKEVIELFRECLGKIKKNNKLVTDYYNGVQSPEFKDNRHDQSILSVARKKRGSIVIPDETWYEDFNGEKALKIPFLATRKTW